VGDGKTVLAKNGTRYEKPNKQALIECFFSYISILFFCQLIISGLLYLEIIELYSTGFILLLLKQLKWRYDDERI
jgi:hypothetical protein